MLNHHLPIGRDYLARVDKSEVAARIQSEEVAALNDHLTLIGISLCALYQAATCHRKCWNQGHVLEALCGRAHNLGAAAYQLIMAGFYDEALNLVRAIGETYNIVLLSVFDKKSLSEWLRSDKKARLRNFSPFKVRLLLESRGGGVPMIVDEDWYADLCEKYVHISAETRPNMHTGDQAYVGGVFQEQGMGDSLETLGEILGALSLSFQVL